MDNDPSRRVVITGVGVVSPLGNDLTGLLDGLRSGASGIRPFSRLPHGVMCVDHGAEAIDFTGDISDYGPLEKKLQRTIRKGSKVMCREIEMGVAVAQLAINDAGLSDPATRDPDRTGVVYGCDYIMSMPEEFAGGIAKCLNDDGDFVFESWGQQGKPEVNPLWLLKYLPNMPASHIAIYNDLRGPNNSITVREASPGAAISEAYSTIQRGHADVLIVGSTGSRIHPLRTVHASMQEQLATNRDDPATMSRPFDESRDGSVVGEGAGAMVFESLQHAQQRGATIVGEIFGAATSAVGARHEPDQFLRKALVNVMRGALGETAPASVGHIHAHGLSHPDCDRQEAEAIAEIFGTDDSPPVTTAKGHFGNLGAGGGIVEIIASLASLGGELFPIRNLEALDPNCPINACTEAVPAGDQFVSANVTPQGQASAVRVGKLAE